MTEIMIVALIKTFAVLGFILSMVPILIWAERKGSAYIQDRRGPNRASILGFRLYGIIHSIADSIKLFFKEDIVPNTRNRWLYISAPILSFIVPVLVVAVVPFFSPFVLSGHVVTGQIADLNVGILFIAAISSFGIYGVMLAGWSSSNSYSLLGGIRAASQMISYEIALALSFISVILYSGTVRLDEMVALQGASLIDWNVARQPLAFFVFLCALFAEAKRNPFDLPEGESEIVAGYHTEYSSMKFALFFMGEYAHIVTGSMIAVALFFGGYQIPFVTTELLREGFGLFGPIVALIQIACFILKTAFFCWLFIWVRWTLPRFRFDQLISFGWKVLIPLGIINIVVTSLVLLLK